jgi:hypothetical protein
MDDTTKKNESGQGSEEIIPGSRKPDTYHDTRQPAVSKPSDDDEGVDLEGKKSRNAGLSEEFFLSDLS